VAEAATSARPRPPGRRRTDRGPGRGDLQAAGSLGFPAFATSNTTRIGGSDPIADAAAVAQAVYPSRSADTRPRVVTLVDDTDWRVAISAAQLMGPPLRAPVLFSQGATMPPATAQALAFLHPLTAKEAAARRSSGSARRRGRGAIGRRT
jgi:hypothetical protein